MKQPDEIEINTASMQTFKESIFNNNSALRFPFFGAFEMGVNWLLNWQKTQPITVYVIKAGESEMVDVFRTPEKAEKHLAILKKDHPTVDFYIEITILE